MAAFEYQALDARGKTAKGVLEADNARHARALLREQKLTPVSVELASQQEKLLASGKQWFKRKISASELALITRQLATLVEAALPIESALQAVAEQLATADNVLLVSHNPLVSNLLGYLQHGHVQAPETVHTATLAELEGEWPMAGLMKLNSLKHPKH